jgi:predicted DNA-binding WGR domain protein
MAEFSIRYFEFRDDKSREFWEVRLDGCEVTRRWGRIGTSGQSRMNEFDSQEEALKDRDEMIAEKQSEGYVEVVAEKEPGVQDHPVYGRLWKRDDDGETVWEGYCELAEFAGYRAVLSDEKGNEWIAQDNWIGQEEKLKAVAKSIRLVPDPDVNGGAGRAAAKQIKGLENTGYEQVGIFITAEAVGNGTHRGVVGLIHKAEGIYAGIWSDIQYVDKEKGMYRWVRPEVVMTRVLEDGTRVRAREDLEANGVWRDGVKGWKTPDMPRDVSGVKAGGVVRMAGQPWGMLHGEVMQMSCGRGAAEANGERFTEVFEAGYAEDMEAVVRAVAAKAQEMREKASKLDEMSVEVLAARCLDSNMCEKERDELWEALRKRGVFKLTIEPSPESGPVVLGLEGMEEAWKRFWDRREEICEAVKEEALSRWEDGRGGNDRVPVTAENLKREMQLRKVYVFGNGEMAKVVMNFEVTWDPEHGMHFQVDGEELEEE